MTSKPSTSKPSSSNPSSSKQPASSAKPTSSTRPSTSLPPSSIAASTIPVVIKGHHLEDELPLGEGSLASKLCHLETSTRNPSCFPSFGDFPASVLPSTQQLSQVKSSQPLPSTLKQSQVKFSRSIKIPSSFPGSALSHSNHRPPSRIRGRPPTVLELNSALLEYLLKSSGQISFSLLKSWAASWGFFTFDGDSVFKVLDLLVKEIEDAVAVQTKGFIGRAGIIVEKDEILRILRILNSAIVQKIKGYLGSK
ncbi:uncharacterized protein K444DRAFT_625321 [Hyaloscypha bicolor E]|uniref:Uncharacterized protein n=1 Tax=Hyaloscypha bicolor E TaxID=1095630 RepID=A0A2J6TNR3_9HELO|nr:uncharacterized protein K444DRAFT_625321 [Hyaloscypha bicolor E]PMD64657.1 hypothetical protein K444DRAFT_625321 [Hyaloscypha bicolor E]